MDGHSRPVQPGRGCPSAPLAMDDEPAISGTMTWRKAAFSICFLLAATVLGLGSGRGGHLSLLLVASEANQSGPVISSHNFPVNAVCRS